jgi:hypothetical protein
VLIALSRRERPIEDPGYEHIANCSPCFREFRELQQARAAELVVRRRRWWLATAATAIFVGSATAWFLTDRSGARQGESIPATELQTVLDLQKYVVIRGEQPAETRPPLLLAAAPHKLTVLLPVGAEPGQYDVQVVDSKLESNAAASGSAQIRNYVTTLETRLDVSSVRPGEYQLALRREGDDWHFYPIVVR